MPPKKVKTEVRINDPELDVAIRTFAHWRSERSKAEKLEKEAKETLAQMLSGPHKEHGADVYRTSDNVAVSMTYSSGQPRISGDRLMELGVTPDVIAQATSRNPYYQYSPQITQPVSLLPE